jgi:hypothetical protein
MTNGLLKVTLNMMTPTKKDSNLVIGHHKVTSATHYGKKNRNIFSTTKQSKYIKVIANKDKKTLILHHLFDR